MNTKNQKKSIPQLGEYTHSLIVRLREEDRWSTADKYGYFLNSITRYLAYRGKSCVGLDEIDTALVVGYNVWMKSSSLVPNTISFYNRVFRAIYHKAVKEYGMADRRPFESVYTGIAETCKRAATSRQIAEVIGEDTSDRYTLTLARDMFAFSYFTRGMTFVDMVYLKKSDINGGYITYIRHKTGIPLKVRIEPEVGEIISKYAALTSRSRYVFPVLGQSEGGEAYRKYRSALTLNNRLLKHFQNDMEQTLTYYVSRHSWATNARRMDVPVGVISESLGHTSERTTAIYLKHLDSERLDSANRSVMEKIKQLLSTVESNNGLICTAEPEKRLHFRHC